MITDRRWSRYTATPAPGVFEGESTEGSRCTNGTCLGPREIFGSSGRLSDGEIGPPTLNGAFVGHAWDQTVSIEFVYENLTPIISGIVLYFYNIPSRGIGLPYNIRITSQSGEHPYLLEGNNNLTQDEDGLRSVTLTPELLSLSTNPSDRFTIEFELHETDQIIWLFLTEVEICISQLGMYC